MTRSSQAEMRRNATERAEMVLRRVRTCGSNRRASLSRRNTSHPGNSDDRSRAWNSHHRFLRTSTDHDNSKSGIFSAFSAALRDASSLCREPHAEAQGPQRFLNQPDLAVPSLIITPFHYSPTSSPMRSSFHSLRAGMVGLGMIFDENLSPVL